MGGRHLKYLDGLRGIAILMVLAIHVGFETKGLPTPVGNFTFYGARGVQLFFIVSGLTLSLSHMNRPVHWPNFAARRFFRIAPMFYLGAAAYLILFQLTPYAGREPHLISFADVAETLLFIHGWFRSSFNLVVPGGWSIATEMMFYCIFPLLLANLTSVRRFVPILLGSYVASAACYLVLRRMGGGNPVEIRAFAVSFWLCQLPAFATGCWLALAPGYDRVTARFAGIVMAAAVCGLLVDSQLRKHNNLLITILLLSALVWSAGKSRPRWLESWLLVRIGEVSFSLYVVHHGVLWTLALVTKGLEPALGWAPHLLLNYSLTLLIAGSISALTYKYIEKPFIALGRRAFAGTAARSPITSADPATTAAN